MIYPKHTNNKRSLRDNKFFKVAVLALSIFIFASLANLLVGRSFISGMFVRVFQLGDYFYLIPKRIGGQTGLVDENIKLKEDLEILRSKFYDYELLKSENERLYRELGLKPKGDLMAAKIIARSPQLPQDSILLDRGLGGGARVGDWVLASERVAIGKVAEVNNGQSVVALNSFANATIYGYLERTLEPIELSGEGGGSLTARVPIDFDIQVGDQILVEAKYPYLVAISSLIQENSISGFKKILFSLPANVAKIRLVFLENDTDE